MQTNDPVVIVGAARTPMGGMLGELSAVSAPELGSVAIQAAVSGAKLSPDALDAVIMGNVLSAGLGQAPARQASLGAGLPYKVGCTTINKMCGSGMKAIMLATQALIAENAQVMVAGGMESMSNAPYLIPKARSGYRLGHGQLIDAMFFDGLEDAYEKGTLMGCFAENTAEKYQLTREQQDAFAITSLQRAQQAINTGLFADEIAPVTIKTRKGETIVDTDEQPLNAKLDKIPQLKPAFRKDGTITAANASSISDGAAALVVMRESEANKRNLNPLAKISALSTHSQEPAWFTTAPIEAIKKVLTQANWKKENVDLFEINEAFAVVTMAAMHELKLPHEIVNIYGGACALGHPIGASGARIVVTLLNALQKQNKKKGVAALCIGGGEATALAVERY
jgi:acetyl-CoA C-acetyltransferase